MIITGTEVFDTGGQTEVQNEGAIIIKPACRHIIDLDSDPPSWGRHTVKEHYRGGIFKWNPDQVKLFLPESQQSGKTIKGHELLKELAGKACNANLWSYLLKFPEIIPNKWKLDENGNTRFIYFLGTTYLDVGNLYVRCFYFRDGCWHEGGGWLSASWGHDRHCAVLC
jgi:hypothetical protein